MSRRILSAFLALVLVAGFAAVTKADVTGSFDIHILMEPMGRQTESVMYFFDIQSNLVVNITISGLTIGFDIGFGTTGIEFAIINLDTNLGALSVSDDFVFAEPFGCTTLPAGPFLANGDCVGQNVFNMGDGDGDEVVDNAVGFVKKRIELELNIAGITLNNLALFEDVDFPDINGSSSHEHDHFTVIGTPYFVGQTDSVVDNQTPTFGFGDVITVSGQTVSGITVTGSTAFCASGRNVIKKRSWPYEVNKACTASLGNIFDKTAIEDGAKTPILFEEETLSVEGVDLGGIVFSVFTEWHPNDPNGLFSVLTAEFTLFDLADVLVVMSSDNITNLTMNAIAIFISSDNLSLTLVDLGGDLQIDSVSTTLALVLNPNQNPADLVIVIKTATPGGLTNAKFSLGVSRGLLSLDTTTSFAGTGSLAWTGTDFELTVDYGIGFVVSASMGFSPGGMSAVEFNLGITF